MTVHSQGEDFEVAAKSSRSLFSGGPIPFPVVQGPILVPQDVGALTSLVCTPWQGASLSAPQEHMSLKDKELFPTSFGGS